MFETDAWWLAFAAASEEAATLARRMAGILNFAKAPFQSVYRLAAPACTPEGTLANPTRFGLVLDDLSPPKLAAEKTSGI